MGAAIIGELLNSRSRAPYSLVPCQFWIAGTIQTDYEGSSQARNEIVSFLAYYNIQRRYSALDFLCPITLETLHAQPNSAADLSVDCQARLRNTRR